MWSISKIDCISVYTQQAVENLKNIALACVAHWIECRPVNQRVTGLIPSQGTCLGCTPGPLHERYPHIDVSLPLFLPPFSSKNI